MHEPTPLPAASATRLRLFPSTPALTFMLLFWVSLLLMPPMMNGDGDLGRHITIGRSILERGSIPTSDLFSHTMQGEPLVSHEWLSQSLFALAHRAAGLDGVAWLTAGVLALAYSALAAGMRHLGIGAAWALAGTLLAAGAGWLHALTRPHIFTLLFFTLFFLLLESYRSSGRWRLLLPLPFLMVVWVNLHGAFISGIVLVALYAAGQLVEGERRRAALLAGVGGTLLLATLLNPAGGSLVGHSFDYLGQRFLVDRTIEYQSPDFHSPSSWPFAALLLASIGLGWRSGRRLPWTPLLVLGLWSAFALYSARNIPLYAQVATLFLAREGEDWVGAVAPRLARGLTGFTLLDRHAWGWMWVALVVALLVGAEGRGARLDVFRMGNRFDPAVFPVAAVDEIERNPPEGKMFNEFAWGGYLLYRLWPEQQVFIDGQTDFYGEALTREYLDILQARPGWEEALDRRGVEWILLPPDRPLVRWLERSDGWEERFRDGTATLWVRR